MEVEHAEIKFKPITITLESQQEVDILWELSSSVRFGDNIAYQFCNNLSKYLCPHKSIHFGEYFDKKSYVDFA